MEPLQTPEQLQWISNLAHWIEGGMFATVAVIAFIQALGYAQSKGAQYLWPGLVLLAGVFLPVYILLQRGLSGIGVTWSLVIRDPQQREHFLMALLLLAVALAQILLLKAVRPPALWKFLGPAALAAIGVILMLHTEYGTAEAIAESEMKHRYLGAIIVLAGLMKAADGLWSKKFKWLAFPWIALLVIAAIMLITYREPPGAYRSDAPNNSEDELLMMKGTSA